ncbi:MAG: hypothetical protein CVV44_19060 [Spirochaetae bacterium HGW-Spirochaetae-1]|jgi:predicted ATP-dependent endonuclease of OLD family|nr:MAG: hypothetical protein CVV44_19060 [Spirochaetae bacterium HGW-Spirochaetae-1]
MVLTKIDIVSYRSILNTPINIDNNLLIFIGYNEAGKTNILDSIRLLDNDFNITESDRPKMPGSPETKIKYHFKLSENEIGIIKQKIEVWLLENTTLETNNIFPDVEKQLNKISLTSIYDSNNKHHFLIDEELKIKDELFFLKEEYHQYMFPMLNANKETIQANHNLIIDKTILNTTEEVINKYNELLSVKENIDKENSIADGSKNETEPPNSEENNSPENKISTTLVSLKILEQELEDDLKEYENFFNINVFEEEIDKRRSKITELKEKVNTLKTSINTDTPPPNKEEIENKLNSHSQLIKRLNHESMVIESLKDTQIKDRYIQLDQNILKEHLSIIINAIVIDLIPNVVYWIYSDQFLVPSDMTFERLMKNNAPWENCRPLYNIFKLTPDLGITNENDLSKKIDLWKKDGSERERDKRSINRCINEYLKNKWPEYTQKIALNIESNRITAHIHDPESSYGSFYGMSQRSQGCRTFISFLLTIAAETHSESISNYILVLDEPETHLHPSGVRFMRNELLKLSELGNTVFCATHSIFMIDRLCLERQVIVKKINEVTSIKYASERALTQEMVLYTEMGTSLEEFSVPAKNIMFEGDADITLFETFYKKCLTKTEKKFEGYVFRDGDGTETMKTFFKEKVINENSKWILILDNDRAGKELEKNIKGKYPSNKEKEMFNYYYYKSSRSDSAELEDLLPINLLKSVFDEIKNENQISIEFDINFENGYTSVFNEALNRFQLDEPEKKKFKAEFKEKLNTTIQQMINEMSLADRSGNKNKESFISIFPEYAQYFRDTFI